MMSGRIASNDRYTRGKSQPTPEGVREIAGQGFRSVARLCAEGEDGQTMGPPGDGEVRVPRAWSISTCR